MTDLSPPFADRLLADLGWIRALAHRLARDPAVADDVSQQACLLALEHRPRIGLRAWCATVVRNLVREHVRSEHRRQRRETAAARADAAASVHDLVARAQAQRDLVQAVLALEEPYRGTVLLRFFEGLPPREIAARTGVPTLTVQSRLTRALRVLRARLDAEHGGAAWLAAVLPLPAPHLVAQLVVGGTLVNTKATAAGIALTALLSIGAYAWLHGKDAAPSGGEDAPAAGLTSSTREGGDGGRLAGGSGARDAAHGRDGRRTPVPSAPADDGPAPRGRSVAGRVVDVDGLPLGNVALALTSAPGQEVARSRGDGTFQFHTATRPVRIAGAEPGFVTLCAGAFEEGSAKDPLVVLARQVAFSGRVVDADQRPLANAHLRVVLASDWTSRNGLSLEATENQSWTARSDGQGHFAFVAAPAVPGSSVRAVLDGYASTVVPSPLQVRDDVEIVLARPRAALASAVRGRVLTQEGDAGAGARVALGLTTTLADDRGFFTIDLARAVTADQLRAIKPGFQLGVLDRPAESGPRGGWPEYVELRLGPQALALAGVVLDHEGAPVAGARVWVADTTPFGVLGHMPLSSEGLASGALIPPQALETVARLPEQDGDDFNDYVATKPGANAAWPFVETDAAGRFKIEGLNLREYRVKVLDGRSLQIESCGPLLAGTLDARLRLPAVDVHARFVARVLCQGRPMPGVAVALRCTPYAQRTRVMGGSVEVRFEHPGGTARTDRDGRFELRDVPKRGCHLILRGDEIVPQRYEVPADAAGTVDIEVDARCQVQVKLRPPLERADAVAAVDDQGQRLDLLVLAAGSTNAYTDLPLHDGASQVFSLSSRARQLVLLKAGQPVDAVDVALQPGRVNLLEP